MSKRILLIDDDVIIIKILQATLINHGYDVEISLDGEQALDKILKTPPDLIILDIHMPRMNGYSFFIEMKKIPRIQNIPVIVVTAKEGMAEIFKFEGAKEYLTKPVNNEQLLEVVKKYI